MRFRGGRAVARNPQREVWVCNYDPPGLPVPRLATPLIVCIDTHRSYADVPSWRP